MSSSWVAIDFETANQHRGSPCAVGMTKVVGGRVAETWGTLIQPPAEFGYFAPFNVAIHGITAADVAGAPDWKAALGDVVAFAGGLPLVAHNAGFDMSVIRAACTVSGLAWPELRYTCSQVVARQTWKLLSYTLPYCADAAGIIFTDHHDAEADATAAAEVMLAALRKAEVESLDSLLAARRIRWGRMTPAGEWSGSTFGGHAARKALPGANPDADPSGPLFGRFVCLTGKLTSMTREEAFRKLAEVGASPVENVTKKTGILVSASQTRLRPGDNLSNKARKAQALLDADHSIEVIDEDEFLRRLQG